MTPDSFSPKHLETLFTQRVSVLLQGTPDELRLLPEVGSEEGVGVGHGSEGGLEGVLEGLGGAGGRGVGVLDTSELEEALDGGRGNETSTTGRGDELEGGESGVSRTVPGRKNKNRIFPSGKTRAHTRTVTEPHLPLCLEGSEWG